MVKTLKNGFILFCILFTMTTLTSSSLQLLQGQPVDTNAHILNRGGVILIAVITIQLFRHIKLPNKVLTYAVPYVISMSLVFMYVWLLGNFVTLHPDFYRDIFLNFTGIAVIVIFFMIVIEKYKRKSA